MNGCETLRRRLRCSLRPARRTGARGLLDAFIAADCRALVIGVTANRFVITAVPSFQLTMRNQHPQVAKDSRGLVATDRQRQDNPCPLLD